MVSVGGPAETVTRDRRPVGRGPLGAPVMTVPLATVVELGSVQAALEMGLAQQGA